MRSAYLLPLVFFIPFFLVACAQERSFDGQEARISDDSQLVLAPAASTPFAIEQPMPNYPVKAYALKQSGAVTVHYSITAAGVVENAQVIESTPPGIFDREVLSAMSKWRFKPGYPTNNAESRLIFNLKDGAKLIDAPVIIKPTAANPT
ncbi:TPA: TonB family protein [Escherichia coli]|jgi:TonB family protein|nr:TonB family protein [Escherichia coli]